jgi:MinD-like ATPase involved in chromosome partitioning or flagellar assembly
VPLNQAICDSGDAGSPIVVSAPDSPQASAFQSIAREVAARVSMITLGGQEKKPGAFIGLERLFGGTKRKS